MTKSTRKSFARTSYDTAAKAKARATVLTKKTGEQYIVVPFTAHDFTTYDVVTAASVEAMQKVADEKAAAKAEIKASVEAAGLKMTRMAWLPKMVAAAREMGATRENVTVVPTPKRIAVRKEGKTVTWFTNQGYVDAFLAAL